MHTLSAHLSESPEFFTTQYGHPLFYVYSYYLEVIRLLIVVGDSMTPDIKS